MSTKQPEYTIQNRISALDVANYLICLSQKIGEPLTNMKLQKLLYYCYAWFLVDRENKETLFDEAIKAWQYGPVVRSVYSVYAKKGADNISFPLDSSGKKLEISDEEIRLNNLLNGNTRELIMEVFSEYGNSSAIDLMKLSHFEQPWNSAYKDGEKESINRDTIYSFYKNQKEQSADSK